jgi:hypothetical protein
VTPSQDGPVEPTSPSEAQTAQGAATTSEPPETVPETLCDAVTTFLAREEEQDESPLVVRFPRAGDPLETQWADEHEVTQ